MGRVKAARCFLFVIPANAGIPFKWHEIPAHAFAGGRLLQPFRNVTRLAKQKCHHTALWVAKPDRAETSNIVALAGFAEVRAQAFV